jgi:hypothetical protein
MHQQYKIILHCQPITTMYSAMSFNLPHFFYMTWKIGGF